MKKINKRQVDLMNSFDRMDSEAAICFSHNRGLTPFYKRLSIKEEVEKAVKVAHGEHEFESIKWYSNTAIY